LTPSPFRTEARVKMTMSLASVVKNVDLHSDLGIFLN
jgi:hypothetical protein